MAEYGGEVFLRVSVMKVTADSGGGKTIGREGRGNKFRTKLETVDVLPFLERGRLQRRRRPTAGS
jgi:hypothetical protein